jgi:hypothetical protein
MINIGEGLAHEHRWATGDALLHSIEANSYGKEVTDGDRDDGGGEEHRRVSGRPNWSSKVVEWRAMSFTGLRWSYGRGYHGLGGAMVVCPWWIGRSPEKNSSGDGVQKLRVKWECKKEQIGGRGNHWRSWTSKEG